MRSTLLRLSATAFTHALGLLLALALASTPARAASLIHDYEFNGNLNDSLGGPALSPDGGTINATTYDFNAGQGLTLSSWLSGAATNGNWTIDLSFLFHDISGYRKIIDFKNLISDNGLYNLTGQLDYYPIAAGGAVISPDTAVRVDLTRDGASGLIVGYLNGMQQFSFTDSSNDATFTAANNIIHFFEDDAATGGGEASAGSVSQIRIYDGALTAVEITALGPPKPVPEPSSFVLLGLGLVSGISLALRRRVRQS